MRQMRVTLLFLPTCFALSAGPVSANHPWICSGSTAYHWPSNSVSIVPASEQNPAGSLGRPEVDYHVAYDNSVLLWDSTVMDLSYSSSGDLALFYDAYGFNGWLGLATIWTSGCVIQQARAQLNDTYLRSDSQTAVDHVACQEVGHTFGLDHNRSANDTCMNDTILTAGNQINQHDRDELYCIYIGCNEPPVAAFTWSNPFSTRVDFDASGSYDPDGKIVRYSWAFGDGYTTTTTGSTVTHWYNNEATYFVSLRVTDDDGARSSPRFAAVSLCPGGQIICEP